MIIEIFFYGMALLAVGWIAGLVGQFERHWTVAFWSPILGIALSLFTALFAIAGPRYSDFWMGGLGHGDGMGLIGLTTIAGIAIVVWLVALAITYAAHKFLK